MKESEKLDAESQQLLTAVDGLIGAEALYAIGWRAWQRMIVAVPLEAIDLDAWTMSPDAWRVYNQEFKTELRQVLRKAMH